MIEPVTRPDLSLVSCLGSRESGVRTTGTYCSLSRGRTDSRCPKEPILHMESALSTPSQLLQLVETLQNLQSQNAPEFPALQSALDGLSRELASDKTLR